MRDGTVARRTPVRRAIFQLVKILSEKVEKTVDKLGGGWYTNKAVSDEGSGKDLEN